MFITILAQRAGADTTADGGHWYDKAIAWAVESGVIAGSDGKLLPRNNIARAQTAQILMNYCEKFGVRP